MHPERDYFQKTVYRGPQLSVFLLSSETVENEIDNFPIDEFVYYMNGRADIKAKEGVEYTFLGGDYIFVPQGFSGSWKSEGQNLFRTLKVTQA